MHGPEEFKNTAGFTDIRVAEDNLQAAAQMLQKEAGSSWFSSDICAKP